MPQTYTAEWYSALDLTGLASNINSALTEVLTGCKSASKMVDLQESGQNSLDMDVVLDARAVFDSVAAADAKATTDKLMLLHALKLKELLSLRVAPRMLWVDTRDMLSDALNKGVIGRDEIGKACSDGVPEGLVDPVDPVDSVDLVAARSFRHSSPTAPAPLRPRLLRQPRAEAGAREREARVAMAVPMGKAGRNTFASFSEAELHVWWQARHFGDFHRHVAWQAQRFLTCRDACFVGNRIGRATSSGHSLQIAWQAWVIVSVLTRKDQTLLTEFRNRPRQAQIDIGTPYALDQDSTGNQVNCSLQQLHCKMSMIIHKVQESVSQEVKCCLTCRGWTVKTVSCCPLCHVASTESAIFSDAVRSEYQQSRGALSIHEASMDGIQMAFLHVCFPLFPFLPVLPWILSVFLFVSLMGNPMAGRRATAVPLRRRRLATP
eukprot:s186_g2.t1